MCCDRLLTCRLSLRCHPSCRSCSGPSHKQCISCFNNTTLTDGLCISCLIGEFLNRDTFRCEPCHPNCESCAGPAADECSACKSGFALDKSRCLTCCSSNINDINGFAQDFDECCHCLAPNGLCSPPVNRPRSVSIEGVAAERRAGLLSVSPVSIILSICVSASVLFAIVFAVLQFTTRSERRAHNLNEYQKVSTNSSIPFEKMSDLMADDYEEEDSLFEKT